MIKCNTIKCETRAALIKNDKYYCAVCYREIFMEDKNNTWHLLWPVLLCIKLNRSLIMEERDLFEGFEDILFEDFDESLAEYLKDKDNNNK